MMIDDTEFHLAYWTCPDCTEPTVYAERLNPIDGEAEGELWCETCGWCAYGTIEREE